MSDSELAVLLAGEGSLSVGVTSLFEQSGDDVRVLDAANASGVQRSLQQHSVDCVLIREQANDDQLAKTVRDHEPDVPVIVLGDTPEEWLQAARGKDADTAGLRAFVAGAFASATGDSAVDPASLYRDLVDHSSEPMYVLDDEGCFQLINPAMARLVGLSQSEIVGASIGNYMSDDEFARLKDALATAKASGEQTVTVDVTVETDDGTEVYENTLTAIDDERFAGAVREVTKERQRVEELQSLTRKIEDLHTVASKLQSCKTEREIYDLSVEAAEDILEFDWCSFAVATEGWFELACVSDDAPLEEGGRHLRVDEGQAGHAFQTGESLVTEDTQADDVSSPVDPSFRSGLSVPIEDIGVLEGVSAERGAFDEDDVELAELLVSNIREAILRVQREQRLREQQVELERQNEQLNEFASVVSHDLRNPLDVAMGQLEVATEKSDGENPHLDLALRAIHRTEELIDDILTLARQGQQIDDTEPVDLETLAEDAWIGRETDATLIFESELGTINTDPNRLYEVFGNLFRNAIEHGGEEVTVSVGTLEGQSGFYVEDDGPGISDDASEHIFESGFTTSDSGTGFGLTIVQEVAQAHGWEVTFTDGSDGGARFEFSGVEFA